MTRPICIGKCIFSIFPAVAHQLKCKHTCIEKCRPDFLSTQDFNEEMIKKSSNIEKCQSVSLWHDQFALQNPFAVSGKIFMIHTYILLHFWKAD